MFKIILIVIGFILGLVFCLTYNTKDLVEGFDGDDLPNVKSECPNILVQGGGRIELRNTRKAEIPGVNPIYFENLEEYKEFLKWQRANGIMCPILAFSTMTSANGDDIYSVTKELSSGEGVVMPDKMSWSSRSHPLYDAGRDDPPFNKNLFPSFDEQDQRIGKRTKLDINGGLGNFRKQQKQLFRKGMNKR